MSAEQAFIEIMNMGKFIITWFWWLILLIWIFAMKMKMKNWPVEAIIIEKRGSNLIKTNDRAGRFYDGLMGIHGYKLQKAKDTIPILDYDWVMHNVSVPTSFFERFVNFLRGNIGTIFLFRYGSKQYKPINIKENQSDQVKMVYQPVKNDKGEEIVIQVYQPLDPRDKMGALSFEVVDWDNMNFMVQEIRATLARRQKQGEWFKGVVVPLIIIGAAVVFAIVMMKFSLDWSSQMRANANPAPQPEPKATSPNIPIISDVLPGD